MVVASFKTQRLIARRPGEADFTFFRKIHTDAEVMKTLSADGSLLDEAASRKIFASHLQHWHEHGYGIWLFDWACVSGGGFVGYCGLRRYVLKDLPETELYFGVRSRFFRRGLGTEMARAVCRIAYETLGCASIIGFTLPDNIASCTLMTKLGMKHEGVIEHAGLPHSMYRGQR
jgi:RimJ/RimL family protein N-acetyltransferase